MEAFMAGFVLSILVKSSLKIPILLDMKEQQHTKYIYISLFLFGLQFCYF